MTDHPHNQGVDRATDLGIAHIVDARPVSVGERNDLFLADDTRLERTVAIRIGRHQLDEATKAKFRNDALKFARTSSHPNIVTTFDAGVSDDGRPYLVFETVDNDLGQSIDRQNILGWTHACDIVLALGSALEAVHEVGLIHRDLRPVNVFVNGSLPKLGDIGLVIPETEFTTVQSLAFRAPESRGGHVDLQSNMYSLTAILYNLIDGRPPYWRPNDTVEALQLRIASEPPPSLAPDAAPASLLRFVTAGLSADRLDRPQDLDEYLAELAIVRQEENTGLTQRERMPIADAGLANAGPPNAGVANASMSNADLLDDTGPPNAGPPTEVHAVPAFDRPYSEPLDPRLDHIGALGQPSASGSPSRPRSDQPDLGVMAAVLAVIAVLVVAAGAILFTLNGTGNPDGVETVQVDADASGDQGQAAVPSSITPLLGPGDTTPTTDPAEATTIPQAQQRTVPDLVSLDVNRAGQILDDAGFQVVVTGQEAPGFLPGTVIRQVPNAGAMVTLPVTVTLYIPRGSSLPTMVGRPADEVCAELNLLGLVCQRETTASRQISQGKVVATNPTEGSTFTAGATVLLKVSEGPPQSIAIPNLAGRSEAEALTALQDAGFVTVTVESKASDSIPAGKVIDTSPTAGSSVATDQPITLRTSSGPSTTAEGTSPSTEPGETNESEQVPNGPSDNDQPSSEANLDDTPGSSADTSVEGTGMTEPTTGPATANPDN